jgi:OOP family OmpA-OmpF porin
MEAGTKILIGAGVTALLAWGSHSAMGGGEKFIDELDAKAQTALNANAISGVKANVERRPQLKRVILLAGDKSEEEKAKIIAQMKAIPGVADAHWENANAPAPATQEAVAACQKDINALMTGKTINFQSGSAYLAENNAILDEVAAALKPCAGMSIEVQGHTDLAGPAEINQKLSQARAESVIAALVAKGIPAERLTAKGYGATQPLENARNPVADAKNRRTVFSIAAAGAAPEGGN